VAQSEVKREKEKYKPITSREIEFLANKYTSLMRRIAYILRTGKVSILLAHFPHLCKYIVQDKAKNQYDFFDYVSGFFLYIVKEDVDKYYKQEITALEIEESLKKAITQWCRYHKLKTFENLNNLKIDN